MRGPLAWVLGIAAGILLVIVASAAIGGRDRTGETVPAGEWAQDVCAAVGVWRGEVEAISESVRASSDAAAGTESGAPTPEGQLGAARVAVERSIQAAKTLVEAIDRSGVPDTPAGEQAAKQVSDWANAALDDLEQAEDLLKDEPETFEEGIEQLTEATRAIAGVLESGRQVIAAVGSSDPELEAAFRDASTCQQLRAETG